MYDHMMNKTKKQSWMSIIMMLIRPLQFKLLIMQLYPLSLHLSAKHKYSDIEFPLPSPLPFKSRQLTCHTRYTERQSLEISKGDIKLLQLLSIFAFKYL